MLLAQPAFICLLLLIMSPREVKLQAVDMCRRISEGQQRMRVLVGHVISTQKANFFDECAALCAGNSSCYSVNYYNKKRKCELNDKTSFNNPEHMIVEDGSYLDIHRPYIDCSHLFCPPEKICTMDRVDRVYCKACVNSPLGMESKDIEDYQITASSWVTKHVRYPKYGRLNNAKNWAALTMRAGEWLQIEFKQAMALTKVATQGGPLGGVSYYVTQYKLSSSEDAVLWKFFKENGNEKVFPGNTDRNTVVFHALSPKIRQVRYIRFVVISWNNGIHMRVELYGCKE